MLFYLTFSAVVAGAVLPSPQQAILAQALVARDGLSNEYHLKMSLTRSVNSEANKEVTTVEVWSKGEFLRFDQLKHESAGDPAHVGRRGICCRNCERKGYHIYTRQGRSPHAVTMVEFHPLGTHEPQWFRFDWTRLGQYHGYSIDYTREPADTYLRHAFETKGEVSEVTHAGQRCYVVQIVMENGSTRRCYFCPAFGMNPVFYVDDCPRSKFHQETTITYAKYPGADVWFPKTHTHVRTQGGKLIVREKIVVEQADLNTPPPDSVFTLAGLGLDYGQPVDLPGLKDPQDHPIWGKNGLDWENTTKKSSALVYNLKMQQQAASAPPPVPDVPQTSYRWLFYAGAAVLAALAAVIAVVLVRRHRAQLGT